MVTFWHTCGESPPVLLAIRQTLNVPAPAYAWAGFWLVLMLPSPKSQSHAAAEPVEVSVNSATMSKLSNVKLAVGGGGAPEPTNSHSTEIPEESLLNKPGIGCGTSAPLAAVA